MNIGSTGNQQVGSQCSQAITMSSPSALFAFAEFMMESYAAQAPSGGWASPDAIAPAVSTAGQVPASVPGSNIELILRSAPQPASSATAALSALNHDPHGSQDPPPSPGPAIGPPLGGPHGAALTGDGAAIVVGPVATTVTASATTNVVFAQATRTGTRALPLQSPVSGSHPTTALTTFLPSVVAIQAPFVGSIARVQPSDSVAEAGNRIRPADGPTDALAAFAPDRLDPIIDFNPLTRAPLEQAIDRFLGRFESLGTGLSRTWAMDDLFLEIVAVGTVLCASELAYRVLRRSTKEDAALAAVDVEGRLGAFSSLPDSWSVEER
jgi:hypothetical protein